MQPFSCSYVFIINENTDQVEYSNTHAEIIESCKLGDRSAQFELYRLYAKAMYNVCLRMVKNETDAEDLLQNSFVDVFSKLHSFQYKSSVGAWMKRIVINNCINFLKSKRVKFEELEEGYKLKLTIAEKETLDSSYSVEKINQAIYKLPEGYRVVFSLYLMEGYDHKEIGSILGVTEATSKSQLSRAKKRIKEILITDSID